MYTGNDLIVIRKQSAKEMVSGKSEKVKRVTGGGLINELHTLNIREQIKSVNVTIYASYFKSAMSDTVGR